MGIFTHVAVAVDLEVEGVRERRTGRFMDWILGCLGGGSMSVFVTMEEAREPRCGSSTEVSVDAEEILARLGAGGGMACVVGDAERFFGPSGAGGGRSGLVGGVE